MFWPFLAFTIVGAVKFGAMSVMVSALTLALQALILANLIGGGCKTACKTFQISGVISVQKLPPWVV